MEPAAEDDMRRLAERVVGDPLRAAALFRTLADVEPGVGVVPGLVAIGKWAWIKRRSRLPAYPFIVLTDTELIVLEFRFGSSLRTRRIVGRWTKTDVCVVEASPERLKATVVLPRSRARVELEGVFSSDAERHVVEHLRELVPGS